MSENVRLQNLRSFTVQIRNPETNEVVGTGIIVSIGGNIVTSAHVIEAAIGAHPREIIDQEVSIYFPHAQLGEPKLRQGKIKNCFPQHDDDIVLLELRDGLVSVRHGETAVLGSAEKSQDNDFRSYGYAQLGPYISRYVSGKIMGPVEKELPPGISLHKDLIQLETRDIRRGLSGAAVLDTKRNLVVGLISQRWDPAGLSDNDNIGWATDAHVLTFDPFNLPLLKEDLQKHPAPKPKIDLFEAGVVLSNKFEPSWNNAPRLLPEWIGRDDLLKSLTSDWSSFACRMTGLIGFGGEGKSSLARQWVDNLLKDTSKQRPDGVFWWGFYERQSVDEFFEVALNYLSGIRIDPNQYPSSSAKAHLIAAMLYSGRFLFILDGLETLQFKEGDQYGQLKSNDLREFLEYFAAPSHKSFCIITSRIPLLDLMDFTTYQHRDIERLRPDDGRALLHKLKVNGSDAELDKVVEDWDGHALTLSLIGGYLSDNYHGDVKYIKDLPPPIADEPRYERIHRVLRRYNDQMGKSDRAFLMLFSAFRMPVEQRAFKRVFRSKPERQEAINSPIAALDDVAFDSMIKRLMVYRILRRDPNTGHYATHPLIRAHYFSLLMECDPAQVQMAHWQIKEYYLAIAGDLPRIPTLHDMKYLIEAVHHACKAGAYDEGYNIHRENINRMYSQHVTEKLGAWETELALLQEYFPNYDISKEPLVNHPIAKIWVLNEIGLCFAALGQLSQAEVYYTRSKDISLEINDWHDASVIYRNLANLYAFRGMLEKSKEAAHEALDLSIFSGDKSDQRNSLVREAWANQLQGDYRAAKEFFNKAGLLQREIDPNSLLNYDLGYYYAQHLRRGGDTVYARKVANANLEMCIKNSWSNEISRCHRILGDLDSDVGLQEYARKHYDEAIRIARSISNRIVLIEGLSARGTWKARYMKNNNEAFSDLKEALEYTATCGYRIHEANIHVGLAWAHLTAGDKEKAKVEAEHARKMSEEMGYYWGLKDADVVLAELSIGDKSVL